MEREIESLFEYVKASPQANYNEPVIVAGEREHQILKERQRKGIMIDNASWKQILMGTETLGISRVEVKNFFSNL